MRKIAYISIITLGIISLINLTPESLDGMLFGYVPNIVIYFMLPFISGIALVLAQDKDRSYKFFPTLLIGSFINSVAMVLITVLGVFVSEYERQDFLYGPSFDIYSLAGVFLPFLALSLFGGLIGILIRGTTLVLKK
jgi:hypothetical protein